MNYSDFMLLHGEFPFHPGGHLLSLAGLNLLGFQDKSATVVDFGAGTGSTAFFFKKNGLENVVSYEINSNFTKFCEFRKNKNLDEFSSLRFFNDWNALMNAVESIDHVLIESVLGFNDPDGIDQIVSKMVDLANLKGLKSIAVLDLFYDENANNKIPKVFTDILQQTFGIVDIPERRKLFSIWGDRFRVDYFREFPLTNLLLVNENINDKLNISQDYIDNYKSFLDEIYPDLNQLISESDEFSAKILSINHDILIKHFKLALMVVTPRK